MYRTLESKRKGAIDTDGDSRTTLGKGRSRSFWVQQPTLSAHSGLLLKVARNLQIGQSVNQERYFIHEESDLQVWNSRWADIRQRTSVCLWVICSVHEGLRHQTHNIQSLPPASKRASRKNCTNCQTLTGEGKRSLQSTTWLQKQSSRHWILSCSTVPGQTAEDNVTNNIHTPTTRTWQFQGASCWNGLSSAEAEILLWQEGKQKPVDISSRWSSHDEIWGHLEESWSSDSSLDSQILCSQRWAYTVQKKREDAEAHRGCFSRDSDLPVTVPSQSERECVANRTSGQTPSQSDDNSQMVRKENVVKTRSGRVVKIPARFRDDDA